jgi:hypothetical protein
MKKSLSIGAVLVAVALSACAPRTVTKISTSADDVKLVYNRVTLMSSSTGIVECTPNKDGELKDCKELEICFWNNKKERCEGHN